MNFNYIGVAMFELEENTRILNELKEKLEQI